MLQAFLLAFPLLLLICGPSPAADLYTLPHEKLSCASLKIRQKDYAGAQADALQSTPGGVKDFLLGMTAAKQEKWDEAAQYLAKAADTLPLLADFALYNEAMALNKLARFDEALPPLQRMFRNFPDTPLFRSAAILQADILYGKNDFTAALASYQKFIEKYPVGTDALSANYKSALCLEKLGDISGSVKLLRTIWLKYPASQIAVKADEDLQKISLKGVTLEHFSAEELFLRGVTLYDLGKYDQAVRLFNSISLDAASADFREKLQLKTGQALYRARHYKDAEKAFALLKGKKIRKEMQEEVQFWLARALDKNGKGDEACHLFLSLADSSPDSELADDALFEAASIRKWQKNRTDSLQLLKKLLSAYPQSTLKQNANWEVAWGSYLEKDLVAAAGYFRTLMDDENIREKALYWYGRTLKASGDGKGAQSAFNCLITEYPMGFYALQYKQETQVKDDEPFLLPTNPYALFALPVGYERAKALITFGLFDEARQELSSIKAKSSRKHKSLTGIARLYLEMDDYYSAFALFRKERLRIFDKESLFTWAISYPLGFRDFVSRNAATNDIPEGLIYSLIRAESSFLPTALSPAGAIGLMQLMPATAATIASNGNGEFNANVLNSPNINIRYGVKHLRDLLTLYKKDVVLAVAAYNAGAGNVNRWRKAFGNMRTDEFVENIPFAETREYVKKVLSGAGIYDRLYKLDNSSIPVSTSSQQNDNPDSRTPRTLLPTRITPAKEALLTLPF